MAKEKKRPYKSQNQLRLDDRVQQLDDRVGALMVRLERFLVRRWPKLARWISD